MGETMQWANNIMHIVYILSSSRGGPPSAGHTRWIAWRVLRPFLVDLTIAAAATARLFRWRQHACLEGLQQRQLPQRASGQRFVPATGGIFWHTCRRAAITIRYHATRPPGQTRSVSNCTSPMSADYALVRCRLCQGQALDKGVRTTVLEDKAGFWSVVLDWTSQEETTTVCRQTKSVLGEESFRQQGRPQETMAASFVSSTISQIKTYEFRWADCRASNSQTPSRRNSQGCDQRLHLLPHRSSIDNHVLSTWRDSNPLMPLLFNVSSAMQHASLPSLIQFLPGSFGNSLWKFNRSSLPCLMHRWAVGIFQLHRRSHPSLRSSKRHIWIHSTSATTGQFRISPSSRSSLSVPPTSKSLDTWSVTIYSCRGNRPTRGIVPRRRRQSKWCLTSTERLTQALSRCSAFSISAPLSILSTTWSFWPDFNTVTASRGLRSSGSSLTCSQFVRFNGETSVTTMVTSGVPQGSVLGPILFIAYSAEVIGVVEQHGFNVHDFADDLQVYVHAAQNEAILLATRMSSCIESVKARLGWVPTDVVSTLRRRSWYGWAPTVVCTTASVPE